MSEFELVSSELNVDGGLRKDAGHILRVSHSAPRDENEAQLLRDPEEQKERLLSNFRWDDEDEGTVDHPLYPSTLEIMEDVRQMVDDLLAGLNKKHMQSDTMFVYQFDVEKYPAVAEVFNGDWTQESKASVMDLICASFAGVAAGFSRDGNPYQILRDKINQSILPSANDMLKEYDVKSILLFDNSVVCGILDTDVADELDNKRTLTAEVKLRLVLNQPSDVPSLGK